VKERISLVAWHDVEKVSYYNYSKTGAMLVTYKIRNASIKEWINLEKNISSRTQALNWIRWRWNSKESIPQTTYNLLANTSNLKIPTQILVDSSRQYPIIKDSRF
jgi:hypothetical protein